MPGHTGGKDGLQTQALGRPASDPGRSPCSSPHAPPEGSAFILAPPFPTGAGVGGGGQGLPSPGPGQAEETHLDLGH